MVLQVLCSSHQLFFLTVIVKYLKNDFLLWAGLQFGWQAALVTLTTLWVNRSPYVCAAGHPIDGEHLLKPCLWYAHGEFDAQGLKCMKSCLKELQTRNTTKNLRAGYLFWVHTWGEGRVMWCLQQLEMLINISLLVGEATLRECELLYKRV